MLQEESGELSPAGTATGSGSGLTAQFRQSPAAPLNGLDQLNRAELMTMADEILRFHEIATVGRGEPVEAIGGKQVSPLQVPEQGSGGCSISHKHSTEQLFPTNDQLTVDAAAMLPDLDHFILLTLRFDPAHACHLHPGHFEACINNGTVITGLRACTAEKVGEYGTLFIQRRHNPIDHAAMFGTFPDCVDVGMTGPQPIIHNDAFADLQPRLAGQLHPGCDATSQDDQIGR